MERSLRQKEQLESYYNYKEPKHDTNYLKYMSGKLYTPPSPIPIRGPIPDLKRNERNEP